MPRFHRKKGLNIFSRERVLWLLGIIFSFLFCGLLLLTIGYFREYQNIPSEHWIGNKVSNVNALRENGLPFSFLVIGDTHGSQTGEALIKTALENEKPSFLIILGDIVNKPHLWDHRFFLTQMTLKIKPSIPVFLVPGNHDIDHLSTKIKEKEQRVTPEVYESLYGARNFNFIFNNCLFIISEIERGNRTGYLDYLRDTLSKKSEGRKHIFVFMHIPPVRLSKTTGNFYPTQEEFFSLVASYKVTSCFFGDYHVYWRGQRSGVNYIISGGGGGRLKKSARTYGKFHHLLKVRVDQSIIGENLIVLNKRVGFGHSIKKWVFIHFFPVLQNRTWVLPILVILLLFWGIFSGAIFVRSLKKSRQVGHGIF